MKNLAIAKQTMIQTIFVALILVVSSCNFNQKTQDTKDIAEEQNEAIFDNNKKERDAQFLVNAAEINMEQIRVGQLAQQNGTTPQIKEFGKLMEDANTKSLNDLTALAKRKMITLPTTPTDNVQDAYGDLNDKSGNDFDKAYADMMVREHEDAIEVFEEASTESYDPDIKNWATMALPDMRAHLGRSIEIQKNTENINSK